MTNNLLEQCLIKEIEGLSNNLSLKGVKGEERNLKGYPEGLPRMSLPQEWSQKEMDDLGDNDPDDALIPYFIVKTTEISFQDEEASAKLYLFFCIYDYSVKAEGYQTLWNLMNRITTRFRTNTVLGAFYCDKSMRAVIQDDDTYPYYFGGIEMTWNLPELEEMEV